MGDNSTPPVGPPPSWLNEEAVALWGYLCAILGTQMESLDRPAFILLCAAFGTAEAAQKDLHTRGVTVPGRGKEEGGGAPVKNPAEPVARQQMVQFIALAKEFGLTPAARKRIKMEIERPDAIGSEDDPWNLLD